jgi:predicted MFS family arabinose efflux permease
VTRAVLGRGPIRTFIPAWLAVNCLVGAWYVNMTSLLKHAPDPSQSLVAGFDERLIGLMKVSFVGLLLLGIFLWTPYLQRFGGPATMRRAVPGALLVCLSLAVVNHTPLQWAPLTLPFAALGILCMAGFVLAAVNYLTDCSEALVSDRSALMAFYTVTLAGGSASGAFLGGVAAKFLLFDGLLLLGVVLTTIAIVSLNAVARYEREHGSARDHVLEANAGQPG